MNEMFVIGVYQNDCRIWMNLLLLSVKIIFVSFFLTITQGKPTIARLKQDPTAAKATITELEKKVSKF